MAPDELLEHFKRLDSIPQELLDHPEVVSLLLPTLRADMELCETYFYAPEPVRSKFSNMLKRWVNGPCPFRRASSPRYAPILDLVTLCYVRFGSFRGTARYSPQP
jgi:hypothetical protein